MTLEEEVRELAEIRKRRRSAKLAQATTEAQQGAFTPWRQPCGRRRRPSLRANGEDMEARAAWHHRALLDRLMLDESRVFCHGRRPGGGGGAAPIRSASCRWNRPSATASSFGACRCPSGWWPWSTRPGQRDRDAAGVCVKSGNACILRGGSFAARSNEVIADVLAAAAVEAGLPEGSISAGDHHRSGGHRCAHGAARPGGRSSPGVARALSAIA